ncbi:uncharacterized protein LOC115929065 [Strongylocentrotus purpuratus]|uniref:Uncharacterized protein n=1 Tax=Strongylocentrotus purpuratus TaxID=7668 RepID=A0A7M7T4E9_STRPU|nr:uncharacterized protein LOC115929065 [Strongylocentrotus purpuratus]
MHKGVICYHELIRNSLIEIKQFIFVFYVLLQDSDITAAEETLQSRTLLAYICEDVLLAGRTVESLQGRQYTYSVLLNKEENKVHHLVLTVWRADEVAEKPPHLETIQSGEVYKHLIERFTSADDLILVYGPLVDATVAAFRLHRKAVTVGCPEVEEEIRLMVRQSTLMDSSDPYEYSDD